MSQYVAMLIGAVGGAVGILSTAIAWLAYRHAIAVSKPRLKCKPVWVKWAGQNTLLTAETRGNSGQLAFEISNRGSFPVEIQGVGFIPNYLAKGTRWHIFGVSLMGEVGPPPHILNPWQSGYVIVEDVAGLNKILQRKPKACYVQTGSGNYHTSRVSKNIYA